MYGELPPLNWLRAFEASARLGNFTLAAEELGLTPSAVSYQVRGLEARLDQKLFRRERKSLYLTPQGQAYMPVVGRAFVDLDASTSALFGKRAKHEITLRCVSSLNALWLLPRIARFRADHPRTHLRLLSASWSETAAQEHIDVDIRYGDGLWFDGEVTPLMRGDIVALRAPALEDGPLFSHPLIEVAGVTATWRQFAAQHGMEPPPAPTYTVDQSLMALELAAQGVGVALVARVFAQPYLDQGRLRRASISTLPEQQGHHIVLPSGRNGFRPEVSALVAWLVAEANAPR